MSGDALVACDLRVRRQDATGVFELAVDALALAPGEVLAVLGPNGSGKSTLLRTLAGLERPYCGRVARAATGPVTMVFQRPILFDGSVEHNLRAALLGVALSRKQVAERTREALERFGIERFAKRRAGTLSGGEIRRLSLARAFALHPAVLLLDEPFDDLDAAGQESLSLDLSRAIAETDVAVAVVTHDLRRALLLADRIAVLRDGRLVQCDSREEVLRRPASPEVARLVGMTNLVAAEVVPGGRGIRIPGAGEMPIAASSDFPAGTAVWAGIRPEHLSLDAARDDAAVLGTAVLRSVISDGVTATFTLDWAGTELRTHVLAGQEKARSHAPGDAIALSLRPGDVHLMRRTPPS